MLRKMTCWIIASIFSDLHDEKQRTLCEYGCELWLYTVISTLGLLLIGTLLGAAFESVVIITIFYLCQSNGGGFHASTHCKCFLTMAGCLVAGLMLIRVPGVCFVLPFAVIIAVLALLTLPLCLHPNKWYLKDSGRQMKVRSRLITVGITMGIVIIGVLEKRNIFHAGCVAMLLSAASRVAAVQNSLE